MTAVSSFLKNLPGIDDLRLETIELPLPFTAIAAKFSKTAGTVLLLSGGRHDCARYHILGIRPWLTLTGRGREMRLEVGDDVLEADADPFETLGAVLNRFRMEAVDPHLPISAGLLGYMAYDLKDVIENLPRTSMDRWRLPHICMYAPSILLVRDRKTDRTWLALPSVEGIANPKEGKAWLLDQIERIPGGRRDFACCKQGFRSNFERPDYMDAITRIREYIADGHVYQVNLSQRFETRFTGDPFALFEALYQKNPAPFFAYVNAGDHQIVSTSPERFLLRNGSRVETRPIKGTRPRGKAPEEDLLLRENLLNSQKDDAELSMIVDLLRNDIGKVCAGGSVSVTEHKRIESYENVYHLVSIVEGRLARGFDSVDLVKATFPGGSITGCPKIRSMEIIDELEPDRRHIYTGSIGYFSFHDTLDLSIAIRTATVYRNRLCFSVGGGIVFDSDPEEEYAETLHKGKTLSGVFQDRAACSERASVVWINGRLTSADRAVLPVTDQGVLYGNGFFETIRVDRCRPLRLGAHLDRFRKTWEHLFSPEPFPDLTWQTIIEQTIDQNGLTGQTAAIRLTATRGNPEDPGCPPTLFLTARPYRHRLELLGQPGLRLATYREPRQTPLADHKTLNYLFYLTAGQWAKSRGADEALVLNPDGTVSETNTANLLMVEGNTVVRPKSAHVLPGVMEAAVCRTLEKLGFCMEERQVFPEELKSADQVLLTNALMGAVSVLELDGQLLPKPDDLSAQINRQVLSLGTD